MEIPAGVMDGINATFTLSTSPGVGNLRLYLNGVLQREAADYSLDGPIVTYAYPPFATDEHVADILSLEIGEKVVSGSVSINSFFYRTVLLKRLLIGDDVADRETIHLQRVLHRVYASLRVPITVDLTVRLSRYINGVQSTLATLTLPTSTPINQTIKFATFDNVDLPDGSTLGVDIVSSDEQISQAGVATFTLVTYGAGTAVLGGVTGGGNFVV